MVEELKLLFNKKTCFHVFFPWFVGVSCILGSLAQRFPPASHRRSVGPTRMTSKTTCDTRVARGVYDMYDSDDGAEIQVTRKFQEKMKCSITKRLERSQKGWRIVFRNELIRVSWKIQYEKSNFNDHDSTLICCKNWATKTIVRRKLSIRHDSVLSWNRPARIFRVKIILTSCTGAAITKMKCHLHIHTKYIKYFWTKWTWN